jgi:hypothetical protein
MFSSATFTMIGNVQNVIRSGALGLAIEIPGLHV